MKMLLQHPNYPKPSIGKIATACAFMLAIGCFSISPAFAEHGEGHGRGGERHGEHGHGGWRGGHGGGYGYRNGYGGYGNGYGYAQPVYIPPPVYAPPMISPGINLVFPLNFRR